MVDASHGPVGKHQPWQSMMNQSNNDCKWHHANNYKYYTGTLASQVMDSNVQTDVRVNVVLKLVFLFYFVCVCVSVPVLVA